MKKKLKETDRQDQNAIQKAVDELPDCGGTVEVPAGEWISGPIHLKSNIKLVLDEDCVIRFSRKFQDYLPTVFTRWEGVECYNYSPMIYAIDGHGISISGKGMLDGQGEAWWHWKKLQGAAASRLCRAQSEGIPPCKRVFGTEEAALRPSMIQFIRCTDVSLDGITVKNGPQWTIHPVYCENVTVRNVKIRTEGPNTDGLNPDSCRNVLIENCEFQTGDDCIAVNSGLNEDGWRVNRPCENVEIRNCRFLGGHAAIAIGSGMSGGVEYVYVHDCVISRTERGIRLKSMRGRGGYIKKARFESIQICDVEQEAIEVSMNYGSSTAVPVSDKAPAFSELCFKQISGKGAKTAAVLKGLPESPLRDVTLQEISVEAEMPMTTEYAEGIKY